MKTQKEGGVALFGDQKIRRVLVEGEWWFSVVDVCGVLANSQNPQVYWRVLKKRLTDEGVNETVTKCNGLESDNEFQLSTICRELKLVASDGKMRVTDCANTEGIFRIIQSIPSPKAEPFKCWLAKVCSRNRKPGTRYGKLITNLVLLTTYHI